MIKIVKNHPSYLHRMFAEFAYARIEHIEEEPMTICSFFDRFEHGSKDYFISLVRNLPEKSIYKINGIIYLV